MKKPTLNINKVFVAGNIANEPEIKESNGVKILTLNVASNRYWKKGEGLIEEVEYIRVKMFANFAENAVKLFKKGDTIFVEGRIHTSKWQEGEVSRYMTEVIATSFQKVNPKEELFDDLDIDI